MNITPQEAQESLDLIRETAARTRRAVAYGGFPYYFILWGSIWVLGFLGDHFLPASQARWLWLALDAGGVIGSFVIGARVGRRLRSATPGARVGLFWLALLLYTALLLVVHPPQTGEQLSLVIVLQVMFGYVVMGLWADARRLALFGVAISALALVGYAGLRPYFNLWMAFLGGGALVSAGMYMLRAWR